MLESILVRSRNFFHLISILDIILEIEIKNNYLSLNDFKKQKIYIKRNIFTLIKNI